METWRKFGEVETKFRALILLLERWLCYIPVEMWKRRSQEVVNSGSVLLGIFQLSKGFRSRQKTRKLGTGD